MSGRPVSMADRLIAVISESIGAESLRLDPVRVGRIPAGVGTPDRYVTVIDERDVPILRVDVYARAPSGFAFEDALIWRGNLIVGFGNEVHAVALADRSKLSVELGTYFGHIYPAADYLLIASGERLFRMAPDRSIVWQSDVLGIDGVVVHDLGPDLIHGEGEWDPPGGWAPFTLSAHDGRMSD